MPDGSSDPKKRRDRPRFDAADVEAEIERNRVANEQFQRDYSAWFEEKSRGKKRRRAGS